MGCFNCFWRKRVIFFKVQLYICTFRRRKVEKLLLCLNNFCLSLAKTDYPLPLATLYTHFSESKESPARINGAKDFRGSDAAAKAWLVLHTSDYRRQNFFAPPKFPFFARRRSPLLDMGFCTKSNPIRHKCYFLYTHAVNRTHFSAQLAYGKMTFTNVSFMFGGINVQVCSKT